MQYDEEESGDELLALNSKTLQDPATISILFFVLLMFFSFFVPNQETFEIGNITFLIGFFLSVAIIGKISWQWLKYKTPQLTCDNIHGSTLGEPVVSGGIYDAYTLGDLKIPFVMRGTEGTVIGPKYAFKKVGENIQSPFWAEKIEMEELPMSIRSQILNHSKCKEPYYMLWYDPILETKIHGLEHIRISNKQMTRTNFMLEKELKDKKWGLFEQYDDWKNRVLQAEREAMKDSKLKKIKSAFE